MATQPGVFAAANSKARKAQRVQAKTSSLGPDSVAQYGHGKGAATAGARGKLSPCRSLPPRLSLPPLSGVEGQCWWVYGQTRSGPENGGFQPASSKEAKTCLT